MTETVKFFHFPPSPLPRKKNYERFLLPHYSSYAYMTYLYNDVINNVKKKYLNDVYEGVCVRESALLKPRQL